MAYSLILSGAEDQQEDEIFDLCSIGSWQSFGQWSSSLPEQQYGALKGLTASGKWQGTDELGKELLDAAEIDSPQDAGVKATLDRLAELVGTGDEKETATISD